MSLESKHYQSRQLKVYYWFNKIFPYVFTSEDSPDTPIDNHILEDNIEWCFNAYDGAMWSCLWCKETDFNIVTIYNSDGEIIKIHSSWSTRLCYDDDSQSIIHYERK